jgi:hypothetical protein
VRYQTLGAGESYDQETYLNHPWVATDAQGNGWALYYAEPQAKPMPQEISIVAPVKPKKIRRRS